MNDDEILEGDHFSYSGDVFDEEDPNRFWGLHRFVGIGIPLVEITRENAYEKVFGGFLSLMDK